MILQFVRVFQICIFKQLFLYYYVLLFILVIVKCSIFNIHGNVYSTIDDYTEII